MANGRRKYMIFNKQLWIKFYCLLTLSMFAFIDPKTEYQIINDACVMHIDAPVSVLHCAVVLIFFCVVAFVSRQKFKFDEIFICMLIKALLDAIPIIMGKVVFTHYFQFYACTLVALFSYGLFINFQPTDETVEWIKKALMVFALILTLQVFYTFIHYELSFSTPYYKQYMVIPYGGTNIIASILVPISCMVYKENLPLRMKACLIGIYAIGIVLTRSFGGIVLMCMAIIYLQCFSIEKKGKTTTKRFVGTVCLTIAILGIFLFSPVGEIISSKINRVDSRLMEGLGNGRIALWVQSFNNLKDNNWLIGYGMQSFSALKDGTAGAHNIVIDLLLKCGIVGTINYLLMFYVLIVRGRQVYSKGKPTFFLMVILVYINSLYEVCYFSYSCDAMLWMFIGTTMAQYYNLRQQAQQ